MSIAVEREGCSPDINEIYPRLPEFLENKLARLAEGLRSRQDPVTWRTTVSDINAILGAKCPDWDLQPPEKFDEAFDLVSELTRDTYMEPLIPEILWSLGFEEEQIRGKYDWDPNLDVLVINARHLGDGHLEEPLLYDTADQLRCMGKSTAVVNFSGHYSDNTTRVAGIPRLLHHVDKVVYMASTQEAGANDVLKKVIRTAQNPAFSSQVKQIDILIPMWGGSRSDKPGQNPRIAYEVLNVIDDAKDLVTKTNDIKKKLKREIEEESIPKIRFLSVDIHGRVYPERSFKRHGYEFVSISPEELYADEVFEALEEHDRKRRASEPELLTLPKVVFAFDNGDIPRSERFVECLLNHPSNSEGPIEVVYANKIRNEAGEVERIEIVKVVRWSRDLHGTIDVTELTELPTKNNPRFTTCIMVSDDDILDSGKTAKRINQNVDELYPNTAYKVGAYTHLITSQGFTLAVDRTGANVIIAGNTLIHDGMWSDDRLRVVKLAPALANAILN